MGDDDPSSIEPAKSEFLTTSKPQRRAICSDCHGKEDRKILELTCAFFCITKYQALLVFWTSGGRAVG